MTEYIKEIISKTNEAIGKNQLTGNPSIFTLLSGLAEELNRLDPRDFGYSVRSEFVMNRLIIRSLSTSETISGSQYPTILKACQTLENSLDEYQGVGSGAVLRAFGFMVDADLQKIVERDYKELSLVLIPGRAWKSAVVLSGSILEAILNDRLTGNATILAAAKASPQSPFLPSCNKLENGKWKLQNLIEVAEDIGQIPGESAKAIDQILRDYRNFIHPKKEIRAKHPCREAQALMAKGALDAVCDHIESLP